MPQFHTTERSGHTASQRVNGVPLHAQGQQPGESTDAYAHRLARRNGYANVTDWLQRAVQRGDIHESALTPHHPYCNCNQCHVDDGPMPAPPPLD